MHQLGFEQMTGLAHSFFFMLLYLSCDLCVAQSFYFFVNLCIRFVFELTDGINRLLNIYLRDNIKVWFQNTLKSNTELLTNLLFALNMALLASGDAEEFNES